MPTLPCISVSKCCHPTWSSTGHISLSGTACSWRPEKVPRFFSEQDLFVWGVAKAPKGIMVAALWQKRLWQCEEGDRINSAWQSVGSRRDVCKWPGAVLENKLVLKRLNIYGTGGTKFFPSKWTFLLKRHFQNSDILWKQGNCRMMVWGMLRAT